jgi:NADH-quinone oxidoreductase subunit H
MMFVLFFVYFISSLAEGSRVPFDLPEADSELVAGYNTEYSGFRFGVYFTAEFANTWIAAALGVIVFLGGWQIPGVDAARIDSATGWSLVGWEVLSAGSFILKMSALIFLSIQLRWTLPRVRVDQMMAICWKYLLPITFVCVFLMLGWMIVWPWESTGALVWRVVMFLAALGIVAAYARRVRFAIVNANDRFYFKLRV